MDQKPDPLRSYAFAGHSGARAVVVIRGVSIARQLGRLDSILETVLPLARSGNFKAITAAVKLIGAQNLILGINQPNAAMVNVEVAPKPTSTDKIEAALERLIADQRKSDDQATHH
jgi:hypothetical protein